MERQGADIQSKVEELEELNQSLRQRDKVEDDAIVQLSGGCKIVLKPAQTSLTQ